MSTITHSSIATAMQTSKKILMEYWPLNAFIATNPLWSLRQENFFSIVSKPEFNSLMDTEYYYQQYMAGKILPENIKQAKEQLEQQTFSDNQIAQWISDYLEKPRIKKPKIVLAQHFPEYQFTAPLNWIKEQLFCLLRDYFGLKHYQQCTLIEFWQKQAPKKLLIELTEQNHIDKQDNTTIIHYLVSQLQIPEALLADYFQAIYLQTYGWASFMNWRNQRPDNPWIPGEDACETILLIWLSLEYMIQLTQKNSLAQIFATIQHNTTENSAAQAIQKNLFDRYIWQTAFELNYLNSLDKLFSLPAANSIIEKTSPKAQFVFCIDTRSEGFRRHIEQQSQTEGEFETFGFAGFFGALFKLNTNNCISYQAPALVNPEVVLTGETATSKLATLKAKVKAATQFAKKQLTSPFALFEIVGFWFSLFMVFKTAQPKLKQQFSVDYVKIDNTFSEEEQLAAAKNLLYSIGLTSHFSEYIFICAHQSHNINNPFKASLNCGACGGNSGVPNALVICAILNNLAIREQLAQINIHIPKKTQFIPACHHTSYDQLEILSSNKDEITIPKAIQTAIDQAAKQLRAEKTASLPGVNPLSQRDNNWAELIPELGLINNTMIIVGPRALTKKCNLHRRAFLHSYDYQLDPDASILTTILSAPAIVAHWISSQYYFSTINPELFGAGNKAIHNVLPDIGVLEGNLSDLKIGLPTQSTHFQDQPIHEPRRLIIVVYAPRELLDQAIANSPDFKLLLDNQWIYLKAIEPNIISA